MATEKMKIELKAVSELKPYHNNPRDNKGGVEILKKSITEFGFQNPIILDEQNVIIAGHTRLIAAKELGLTEVPTITAYNLTPNQAKAFRLMDNKSQDYSQWDYEMLRKEIEELEDEQYDTLLTGFENDEINFFLNRDNENDAYKEWRESGGLPYINEDVGGVFSVKLNFYSQEAIKEFAELIGQNITSKTSSINFPKQEQDKISDLEYTTEDN